MKKIAEKKDKKGTLKEGIKKLWDTFTKKKVNPYWFLFNDLLVYCDFKTSVRSTCILTKASTDLNANVRPRLKTANPSHFCIHWPSRIFVTSLKLPKKAKTPSSN